MKRLITSLLVIVFAVILAAPVSASHYWQIRTSDPESTSQARTFNLEFVTLSTDQNDDITVKLFQDGAQVDSMVTTKAYGDSGAFKVTVPDDGTYEFHMTATSSVDAATVASETRTVAVEGREVNVVNREGNDGVSGRPTDANAPGGTNGAVQGDTNNDGVVDENDEPGQVTDEAASTNEDDKSEVLGDEDSADSRNNWPWIVLLSVGVAAAAYYWFFYREGRMNRP